jgi:intein-encoded DNA endonuclease-like protein
MEFINKERQNLFQISDKSHAIGLLSGLIDSDGYVSNGEIQIVQKDIEFLKFIKNLCEKIEISTRKIYTRKNFKSENTISRLGLSTKFKYLGNNSYKIKRAYG